MGFLFYVSIDPKGPKEAVNPLQAAATWQHQRIIERSRISVEVFNAVANSGGASSVSFPFGKWAVLSPKHSRAFDVTRHVQRFANTGSTRVECWVDDTEVKSRNVEGCFSFREEEELG